MNRHIVPAGAVFIAIAFASCTVSLGSGGGGDTQKLFESAYAQLRIAEPSQRQNTRPLVMAHYMPWFQKYGYHWSEGSPKFNPEEILPDGRANIASHYYPLTGNYDSADPVVLEYQLALMKMAGIDGLIFDWYGVTEGLDYKPIHDAVMATIALAKKHGFKYAVCFEDQSIRQLVNFGIVPKDQGRVTAKETFAWMEQNWFADEAYVKVAGRPLVLCFGPQYFYQKSEWDEIWAGLGERPFFIDLDARTNWADGAFNWSPMSLSANGKLSVSSLVRYLNDFYTKQEQKPFVVGTVFPAFHDIYAQAGKASYGYLDYYGGETLRLTWAAAERARANVIQIQTWNDYGEGTVIEPTIERGYADLEFIQDKRLEWEGGFPFNYGDLRIPIELYKIIANEKTQDEQKGQIAGIYELLFAGDAEEFRREVRAAGINYDFSVSPLLMDPASAQAAPAFEFDPAGRVNLALRKTVTVSSYIDVWTGPKATDGEITESYWEGAARAWPGILQVDLEKPEKIATVVIRLDPRRLWSKRTQRIEVKTGDDGQNWATAAPAADYYFDPAGNANSVAIPLDATARYVQLVFTANTGATNGQVAELEIYGE